MVGTGASAGGLEAFKQFFRAVSPEPGLAFVVVQHLDPKKTGILPELLQRMTPMPVVKAEREGEWVRFAVTDNGIGIEEEYYDRIFVIFQRLHTPDRYEGTGISLPLVKRIVEQHGDRTWARSETGRGSTFYFTLPAA